MKSTDLLDVLNLDKQEQINNKNRTDTKKKIANPTITSIYSVEFIMSKFKEFSSKNKLYKALDKPPRYPTFKSILSYLERSNKIMFDGNSIVWISDYVNEKIKTDDNILEDARKYNLDQLIKTNSCTKSSTSDETFDSEISDRLDSLKEKLENE